MKNFRFSFVAYLAVLTCLISCNNSAEVKKTIGVLNEGDCMLSKLIYEYPSMTIETTVAYDEQNRVSEITRKVNGDQERVSKLKYNEMNQISQFEIFIDDTLSYYETLEWKNNKAISSFYEMVDGKWQNLNKTAASFLPTGEINQLDDYMVDSNEVWSLKGTLYDYYWENGNLQKLENYIIVEENKPQKNIAIIDSNNYMITSINNKEYMVDTYAELELYYSSNVEYSEGLNPLHHVSIAKIIEPNNINCSKNLLSKNTKKYVTGEVVTYSFEHLLNEKGYPTETTVNASAVTNHEDKAAQFKIYFEYTNCK